MTYQQKLHETAERMAKEIEPRWWDKDNFLDDENALKFVKDEQDKRIANMLPLAKIALENELTAAINAFAHGYAFNSISDISFEDYLNKHLISNGLIEGK